MNFKKEIKIPECVLSKFYHPEYFSEIAKNKEYLQLLNEHLKKCPFCGLQNYFVKEANKEIMKQNKLEVRNMINKGVFWGMAAIVFGTLISSSPNFHHDEKENS